MSFFSIAEIAIASEIATPQITILPPPNWVEIRPLTLNTQIPLDDLSDGIYYRLLDTQIDISASGDRSHYSRFAETVVNKAGVDANSQINISYDPSYQQLVFHHLTIHRNEQQLDKLTSSKISIFHNETKASHF